MPDFAYCSQCGTTHSYDQNSDVCLWGNVPTPDDHPEILVAIVRGLTEELKKKYPEDRPHWHSRRTSPVIGFYASGCHHDFAQLFSNGISTQFPRKWLEYEDPRLVDQVCERFSECVSRARSPRSDLERVG